MSLITRCPTCRTMFQVATDQLEVSDGWVRCGQCDGVFDASAHFQVVEVPAAAPTPAVAIAAALAEPEPPASAFDNADRAVDLDFAGFDLTGHLTRRADSPVGAASAASAAVAAPAAIAPLAVRAEPIAKPAPEAPAAAQSVRGPRESSGAALASYLSAPEAADRPDAADRTGAEPARAGRLGTKARAAPGRVKPARGSAPDLGFVRTARRRAGRNRPLYRALAAGLTLLLLGALVLQVLLHERDALAAHYPGAQRTFEWLCDRMACQIKSPRVIEAVVIDSSSFTQTGPDAYRINFVLKNTRAGVIAMPALEVTLTGAQDQVLVRRVVFPAEWGQASDRLERDAALSAGFTLWGSPPPAAQAAAAPASATSAAVADSPAPATDAAPATLPVTGYRLIAFYP